MTTQLKIRPKPQKTESNKGNHYDLIIIGGGPAGLTAAIYAARARLNILLIEKMIFGGQASTTWKIDNYPGFPDGVSGMDLSQRLQDQVKKLDVPTIWGDVSKIEKKQNKFQLTVESKNLTCQTVIIATGSEAAKLGVPGEDEFRGRGVSYCATCDGAFYKDKNIMVVGGGNSAIEEAMFLTRFGKKVFIAHRRDELRADKILAERAAADPKTYFFWHSTVEEIQGNNKVETVVLKNLKEKKSIKVPIDGIFIYVGSKPNSEIVKELVKLDKVGFIKTNEEMKTKTAGLFAAGDIRVKSLKQIVTAAADGAIAAESARKYLESLDS